MEPKTIILYHAHCPDGFGAAYAAWKKFGDAAEYIPCSYGKPVPEGLAGNIVYFVDFCYEQEVMDAIAKEAASVTVLDHHLGTKDIVESMPEYVFDEKRSGATITWSYFHPDTQIPKLLKYVEDDDLYRFTYPETRPILSYLSVQPFTFSEWDTLVYMLEDPDRHAALLDRANVYGEYFELLAHLAAEQGKLVSFEGHEVYFGRAHPFKPMQSRVGHMLAEKKGPFALVVSAHPEGYGVSIRGDGSIDVSAIARKYGGNGHPDASGFMIPLTSPMPWTLVKEDENPRN
jgi:oligoribonuclease NrnB/cAMP/cGMP phosphodiesterase (DHH superfamily)